MDKIEAANCQLCGEPMPQGEEMFNYHGYSGPCPKPPLAMSDKPAVPESTKNTPYEVEVTAPSLTCVRIINPTLYRDPNNPDALSFTPFPAASPVAGVSQQDEAQNLRYAKQIAESMARKFYPEVTQWKPLEGDMFGLIMQIDNMQTGLKRARPEGDGWIAVTPETMPEHMEVVRVVTHSGYQEVCVYRAVDNSFETHSGLRVNIVLHWKPLDWPSPPVANPLIGSGTPSVEPKMIGTKYIAGRFRAGESIAELAEDYRLSVEAVEQAVRYEYIRRCQRNPEVRAIRKDGKAALVTDREALRIWLSGSTPNG